MARKGNPISVRLDQNRSSDSSWFSDYYYGKSVYQDVNLRSYFASIRPPTRRTFGFRLGRCIIIHFPKRKFIHFFLPHRQKGRKRRKRRARSRLRKKVKGWWCTFRKVGPISCLHSREGTKEEGKEVRGRGAGKRVESIRRGIPPKMDKKRRPEGDRIKKNLSKLLRASGVKHPKYARHINDVSFLILMKKDKSLRKRKLFNFFKKKKSAYDSRPTRYRLRRTVSAVRPSLNYSVMQYLLNRKKKMHFDPVAVLNHFVAPGVVEPSTMGGLNAQGRGLDKRIRFAIFATSSVTEDKKRLTFTHFIREANHLGRKKRSISLFPFFGATFFFPRDGLGVDKNLLFDYARELVLRQLRANWNLITKDKVKRRLIEKFIDLGGIGELRKGIEMMMEIILRKRRIPYGYNSYLNEVRKSRSFLSNRTATNTLIYSVKIKSLYQSASLIAQDISFQPRKKSRSFRSIFCQIVKDIPLGMKKGVEGIRISCSGRSEGAEIARTKCGKYRKTSCNVFHQKIDYAPAEVSTRYGISGVKVWISYSQKERGRAISETYEI
uniref:Small ribosomal subunit protein uS3m n=1 Tax=Platycodon grandiflorus TaxID=94286 RepID=A0A288W7A9_PLAGD|nr:ribosomal protein S3 [Platycodon grandiflorus]ARR27572.1 ribosomal protein S3 [Platycodon grandiflorus]AWN57597.1 ribosomal protein S3 [Platycodon grandiflorus]